MSHQNFGKRFFCFELAGEQTQWDFNSNHLLGVYCSFALVLQIHNPHAIHTTELPKLPLGLHSDICKANTIRTRTQNSRCKLHLTKELHNAIKGPMFWIERFHRNFNHPTWQNGHCNDQKISYQLRSIAWQNSQCNDQKISSQLRSITWHTHKMTSWPNGPYVSSKAEQNSKQAFPTWMPHCPMQVQNARSLHRTNRTTHKAAA